VQETTKIAKEGDRKDDSQRDKRDAEEKEKPRDKHFARARGITAGQSLGDPALDAASDAKICGGNDKI
jgi:hypothetical protein